MRAWTVVFGITLLGLWLAGLNSPNSAGWLTWVDGLAGVLAFLLSASIGITASRRVNIGGPTAFAVGLFVAWAVGLATGAPFWQSWWNFGVACCFAAMSAISGRRLEVRGRPPSEISPTFEEERERFRRRAS